MTIPATPDPAKPGAPTPSTVDNPAASAVQPFSPSAILPRLQTRFPAAKVELVTNPGPAAEHSLLLDAAMAREIATFLRDDDFLRLDYCSNATGIDWPEKEIVDTMKKSVPDPAGGPEKIIEEKTKRIQPGCLEAVYHLYSMALKSGPVVIRVRTANRSDQVTLPSLTPVWKSCDFQEREIYDLYGIVFEGHPDLRRLLMWDGFKDHPMRRDYVTPDDFEWEPTPHGGVLDRAKAHYPSPVAQPLDEPRRSSQSEGGPPLNSVPAAKEAPKP